MTQYLRLPNIAALLLFFIWNKTLSQNVQLLLTVNPQAAANFSQWNQAPGQFQLIATNTGAVNQDVRLVFDIRDASGKTVASMDDPQSLPTVTLPPGSTVVNTASVFSTDFFNVSQSYNASLGRGGSFPSGGYDLCARAVSVTTGATVTTNDACAFFFIERLQSPLLIFPTDGYHLCGADFTTTVFQWTPVLREQFTPTAWNHFVICELYPGQTPREALVSNVPVVEQFIPIAVNQWIWPENLLAPGDSQDYVWGVNIYDGFDKLVADYNYPFRTVCRDKSRDTTRSRDSTIISVTHTDWPRTYTKEKCSTPGYKLAKGSEVSLGMTVDNIGLLPYPRAVPIRAEGKDVDVVTLLCAGCEGKQSEMPVSIRDNVGNFQWVLMDEKGSLNTPFDLQQIDSLDTEIAKILKRLKTVNDSLASIKSLLSSGLDQKKSELQAKIDQDKEAIKQQEEKKSRLRASIDSITKVIQDRDKNGSSLRSRLAAKKEEVRKTQSNIDSLEKALKGGPGSGELALLDRISQEQKAIEDLEETLKRNEAKWADELSALQDKMRQALKDLDNAVKAYNKEKDRLEAMAMQMSAFETALMKTPDGRRFLAAYQDWDKKLSAFTSRFDKSGELSRSGARVTDAGLNILSVVPGTKRSQYFTAFSDLMSAFSLQVGSACNNGDQACKIAVQLLDESGKSYSSVLQSLSSVNLVVDPARIKSLDSLRKTIEGGSGSLSGFKQAVKASSDRFQEAQDAYYKHISDIEAQRRDYQADISRGEEELAGIEQELRKMATSRQEDEDANRKYRLQNLAAKKAGLRALESQMEMIGDSLFHAEQALTVAKELKAQLGEAVRDTDKEIQALKDQINDLEKQVEKLKELKKSLEKRQSELQKEKTKLEAQLSMLTTARNGKLAGNKIAYGPVVYYIPPPLEDVLRDKARFNELKDSISKAEANLQLAIANKEAVQGRLLGEVEKVASSLVRIDLAKKLIEASEETINEEGDELKRGKTRKYQEYLAKQQEAQAREVRAKTDAEKAGKEEEQASEDKEEAEKDVDEAREKVKGIKEELEKAESDFHDRQNELAKEQELLENAKRTLEEYTVAVLVEESNLQELELRLSQLNNDLTRASALQKDDEIAGIRAEIQLRQGEIRLSRDTKLPALREKVASAAQSVEAAAKRVKAVQEKDDKAMLDWKAKLEEYSKANGELIRKNNKYEAALNKENEKKKEKEEADEALEKAAKEREELQEDIEKQVGEDKDIKKGEEKVKDAEAAKEKAEADKEAAENEIRQVRNDKDALINKAKQEVENAKAKLKKAEDDMREFLKKEFEFVNFQANIKLIGSDKVADKWRTADGKQEKIAQLIYAGNRFPRFTGTPAEDKSPGEPSVVGTCNPMFSFDFPPDPNPDPATPDREPRTIALMYRHGEPLWPEWPVIRNDGKLLAKDVVPVYSGGSDDDYFRRYCVGNVETKCSNGDEVNEVIKDLGSFTWEVTEGQLLGFNPVHPWMMWETNKVDKPQVEKIQEIKVKYLANELGPDEEKKNKGLPVVRAGVLVECSKDIEGVPEAIRKIQGRVVTGDHKPLEGEEVEFEVMLVKGEAKNYGFDGGALKVTRMTAGGGYAKTDFSFGKGYAEFQINIRWKRGGNIVDEEHLKAVSPMLLFLHRFATGAPDFAWDAALQLLSGEGDIDAALGTFPKKPKEQDKKTLTLRGVAGLQNADREFIRDEVVEFTVTGGKKADPATDKTKGFGLARTHVPKIKEKETVSLMANTEVRYRPVTKIDKPQLTFSNTQEKKFRIGSFANPFVIIMDEGFNASEPLNGKGRLGMEIAGTDLLKYLKNVTLDVDGVVLQGEANNYVAVDGVVKWDPGDAGKYSMLGLDFTFTSLGILAQKGATLEGLVKHEKLGNAIKFAAELDADGNFMCSLDSLPEVEVVKFKLKKGTGIDLDMHDGKSPGTLEPGFKGILIRSAKLGLPEVFNGRDKTESVIEVTNFYIGSRSAAGGGREMGFGGKVALTGSFFKIGYAGYDYSVQELTLEFENSALSKGSMKGELALPMPFEGKVITEVEVSGEGFSAGVSTERPVTIPKLGVSMTFLSGTGIEYIAAEKAGKLTINAFMVTRSIGEIEIKGFEAGSDGTIKAKEITLEKSVKFGSGFDLHIRSFGFSHTSGETSITVKGGFAFAKITEVNAEVTVTSGPSVDVKITDAKVKFEYNPVSFSGEFTYNGREFSGKFDIGIKKVIDNGIQGMLVIGNVETGTETSWNYWYAELKVGTKIPLGQSGLMVLGLGGGVGYNYIPPVGDASGHPEKNDALSLKAIMEMGTAPGGEVFAGRMEMVLVPGQFSLYGKVWLLTQRESLYGEGLLNLQWSPNAQIDGYVGMFIGVPNEKGGIFQAGGRINFFFAGPGNFYIRSEKLGASVLQAIKADASIDVNNEFLEIRGKLYYKVNKSVPLILVTAKISLDLSADALMKYTHRIHTLRSHADFKGSWDVDLETPMGNADVTNGDLNMHAEINATDNTVEMKASVKFTYNVWLYSGSTDLELGYNASI